MGFLSGLGKVLSIAGPLAAAPFTGGTSLLGMLGMGSKAAGMIGAGLGAAGRMAGGAANQRAADRGAQAEFGLLNDRNRLDYAQFNRQAGNDSNRQLMAADRLSSRRAPTDPRAQPYLSGASVSPETIARIRQQATAPRQPMQVSGMPQPGRADSALNALSMGGSMAGLLQEILARRPKPQPTPGYGNIGQVQLPNIRF